VRREELLSDLREHISAARARLDQPSEADVRAILERLGDPTAIAAEARIGEPARPSPVSPIWMAYRRPIIVIAVLAFVAIVVAMLIGFTLVAVSPGR
jgi:uncharacterized membrane protein